MCNNTDRVIYKNKKARSRVLSSVLEQHYLPLIRSHNDFVGEDSVQFLGQSVVVHRFATSQKCEDISTVKPVRMNPSRKKGGERKMIVPKSIKFVKSCGSYKAGYDYPAIRLPHTFAKLAGLSTQVYQTVHQGALAFLIVISSANVSRNTSERPENNGASAKASAFTRRHYRV